MRLLPGEPRQKKIILPPWIRFFTRWSLLKSNWATFELVLSSNWAGFAEKAWQPWPDQPDNDRSMRLLYSASAARPQVWSRVFWSSLSSSLSVFPVEKGRSSLLLWWVVCVICLQYYSNVTVCSCFDKSVRLKHLSWNDTHILTLCYVSYLYALQLCLFM